MKQFQSNSIIVDDAVALSIFFHLKKKTIISHSVKFLVMDSAVQSS